MDGIVATCPDDTSTTGISSYSESTEYGAPRDATTAPDTYGWLGTKQRSTNDLAGLTLMGIRLYNPTTGRFLSVDPVPGGNDNPYVYVYNPTDQYDLDGNCWRWRWCHRAWGWTVRHRSSIASWAATGACIVRGPWVGESHRVLPGQCAPSGAGTGIIEQRLWTGFGPLPAMVTVSPSGMRAGARKVLETSGKLHQDGSVTSFMRPDRCPAWGTPGDP